MYEVSELLSLSKKIAAQSGIGNCRFEHKHSTEVRNPPKADIVVCETLGNFALEENIIEIMNDARRFLKPGGVMIPAALEQFVAPVSSERLWRELNIWDGIGYGLDFAAAKEICLHNIYVKDIGQADLLRAPDAIRSWDTVDFREDNASIRQADIRWKIAAPVTVYGFAVWWQATLAPGITLGTAPGNPQTHWQQIFLPIQHPIALQAGHTLELFLHSDSRISVKIRVRWEVTAKKGATVVTQQKMDMRKGHIE